TEGVDLLNLEAVLAAGGETQLERILAGCELSRARLRAPQRAVVGSAFARQAALRFVVVRGTQQSQILAEVLRVLVVQELYVLQRGTQGVDLGDHEVGAHAHQLALRRRRSGRHRARGRSRGCLSGGGA